MFKMKPRLLITTFSILIVLQQPSLISPQPDRTTQLNFSYVLSDSAVDPVYGVSLTSTVPAVDMALDYINNNSTLLPGINLTYGQIRTMQCGSRDLVEAYFGILGYSCQVGSTELALGTQILFTPSYDESPDRKNGSLYRLHPTSNTYTQAVLAFVRQFNWQRFSVLTRGGGFFDEVRESIFGAVENSSITLIESPQNGTEQVTFPNDVRIFFVNMDLSNTTKTMCKAYLAGMLFPSYVWVTYSRDYQASLNSMGVVAGCDGGELSAFLDGVFTIQPTAAEPQGTGGFTAIKERLRSVYTSESFTPLVYFVFDSVWMLAHTLNDSLNRLNANDLEVTGCESRFVTSNNTVSLVQCLLDFNLQNISIAGITGEISFNRNGSRIHNILGLEVLVARITVTLMAETSFNFTGQESASTIFRGPIPLDGTPIKDVQVLPIGLIIAYYIVASMGVVFSIVCLVFTIVFRKRKIVKLTTPNLNYFIVAGALLLYTSVYFRIFPSKSPIYAEFLCNFQVFATSLGYILCFAPVLMKMWRVYYIFHNPRPAKKVVMDWHLVLGVSILVGVIMFIIILGVAVPPLRPLPQLVPDTERPIGRTREGITIIFCAYECYGRRSLPLIWTGVNFIYLVLMQVAAFILALLTRNVKIRVLNDSKEMAFIIYTTSVVLLALGGVTFGLSSYIIITEVLFSGGVMFATTVFLTLLFLPKMLFQYKDPTGEMIFDNVRRENSPGTAGTSRTSTAEHRLTPVPPSNPAPAPTSSGSFNNNATSHGGLSQTHTTSYQSTANTVS